MRRLSYLIVLVPLAICVLISVFLWRGLQRDPHQIPSPLINHPVPEFSANRLLKQQPLFTEKQFKGHITLLNVFATWCVSCRAEHPILMDIKRSKQVVLVGLNYKDQADTVQQWLKQYGNPYQTVILDPEGTIGINFGVYGTPESFLIDRKGVIRYKYLGPLSAQAWQDELLPQIKKLNEQLS